MKVTLTSMELKGPLHFFALSRKALQITRQLKATNCLAVKTRGFWTKHYTMTLWESEKALKDFAKSGAHLKAMQNSASIAREIRTVTYDATELPNWKTAKERLRQARPIIFAK